MNLYRVRYIINGYPMSGWLHVTANAGWQALELASNWIRNNFGRDLTFEHLKARKLGDA